MIFIFKLYGILTNPIRHHIFQFFDNLRILRLKIFAVSYLLGFADFIFVVVNQSECLT